GSIVLGRELGRCSVRGGYRATHLLLRRIHGGRRCRRLSHRARGRAHLAAGELGDFPAALFWVSLARLDFGGEDHRAEGQQASRTLRRTGSVAGPDAPAGWPGPGHLLSLWPADGSHLTAASASAEKPIAAIGLETRHAHASGHLYPLQNLSRS